MFKTSCKLFCSIFLVIAAIYNFSFAQTEETVASDYEEARAVQQEKALKSIEVLTGFGWNKLKSKTVFDKKPDYNLFPIIVDLDFDLKRFTKKIGFNPPGVFDFQLEPFIAPVSKPNANVEIGNSFMLKLGLLPETSKFQPFIKAGVGMVYMSQHTEEQSTQFNFIETGAVGAHFYFTKNTSLVVEGRMRHLSNAGIDQPNSGINTYFALVGLSYKY